MEEKNYSKPEVQDVQVQLEDNIAAAVVTTTAPQNPVSP